MRYYRDAVAVPAGQWTFYPELMLAENCHNGSLAWIVPKDGGYIIWSVNFPAEWMLKELAEWFAKWITGKHHDQAT